MRPLPWLLIAAFASACTGLIADPGMEPGAEPVVAPDDPRFCDIAGDDPGRVTMRRLNREEYNNTVRDLLGDTTQPANAFPQDNESGDGFRNNGDTLTIGDVLMEQYADAAQALALAALGTGSPVRAQYMTCDAASRGTDVCARQLIRELGLRAWRRPLADEEVERLRELVDVAIANGGSYDEGIGLAMRGMLLSPNFLFRVERNTEVREARGLSEFELASRLSYFLWSSMPDEELFTLAGEGRLSDPEELRRQVDRMLSDGKADAFFASFAAQWLHVTRLGEHVADSDQFDLNDQLKDAMAQETLLYIRHVIETNKPLSELLTSDWTFLNERLAAHYGIEGVTGNEMRLVELTTNQRGGLLTQAAVLTVNSNPDRTSPVKRGKFVLDQFLCEPPADPPPDVDTFVGGEEVGGTLRERMERHRADPVCASCHAAMDPIGFGLENYDAVGAWRTEDNALPIDASGELPDGSTFDGAAGLSQLLNEDERFNSCVTRKVMAYALGRGMADSDRCFVESAIEAAQERNLSMRELIIQIVTNDVFTKVGGRLEGGR